MMKKTYLALGLAALLSAACDNSRICTLQAVWGLSVTVVGGAESAGAGGAGGEGGQSVSSECAATVTAVDGSYSDELQCSVSGEDCVCYGAAERPGNYQVTATLGERTEVQSVTVRAEDECHVATEELTFFED